MHSPSPSSSSPPSKLSLSSLAQYTVFALVLYVLAGAPLSNVITNVNSAGGKSRTSWEKTSSTMGPEKMSSLVFPERNLTCEPHAFKGVYVLSREPLVVYIEGFLGEAETDEVIGLRYVFLDYSHTNDIQTPILFAIFSHMTSTTHVIHQSNFLITVHHFSPPQPSGMPTAKPSTSPSGTLKKPRSHAPPL